MAARKTTSKTKAVKPKYEPTEREREVVEAYWDKDDKRGPVPSLKLRDESGSTCLETDHKDDKIGMTLIASALGSADPAFSSVTLSQLVNITSDRQEPDEAKLNYAVSAIRGIGPQDEIESMLAAQMVAVHLATMTFARRLNCVDTIPQQDSAERAFNKLARTFTAQVDALKRYRTGGEQKMTVQHVHVNEGGQAVVGNVSSEAKAGGG